MQTLIVNGSTRERGDTAVLVNEMQKYLSGEVLVVRPEADGIRPCSDCRHCREHAACALQDSMQLLYDYVETCDVLVLASPVWFGGLSGPLLNFASRGQRYFSARHFRREETPLRRKLGALLLAGAEPETEDRAITTAHSIFKMFNAGAASATVRSMDTDRLPTVRDMDALYQAKEAALLINVLYEENLRKEGGGTYKAKP